MCDEETTMVPGRRLFGYHTHMANVTIKDIDNDALAEVARRAHDLGMSTQEYLRRLIARDASRPRMPDELATLAERVRAERTPMSMDDFDRARRGAIRSA